MGSWGWKLRAGVNFSEPQIFFFVTFFWRNSTNAFLEINRNDWHTQGKTPSPCWNILFFKYKRFDLVLIRRTWPDGWTFRLYIMWIMMSEVRISAFYNLRSSQRMASARELFGTSEFFFCQPLLLAPSATKGKFPNLRLVSAKSIQLF